MLDRPTYFPSRSRTSSSGRAMCQNRQRGDLAVGQQNAMSCRSFWATSSSALRSPGSTLPSAPAPTRTSSPCSSFTGSCTCSEWTMPRKARRLRWRRWSSSCSQPTTARRRSDRLDPKLYGRRRRLARRRVPAHSGIGGAVPRRDGPHPNFACPGEVARGLRPARRPLVEEPETFLAPILLAVLLCQLVAATLVGVIASQLFGPIGVAVATAFEVVVIFVFSEAVPKQWAVRHSDRAALLAAPLVTTLIAFPPTRVVSGALIGLARLITPGG